MGMSRFRFLVNSREAFRGLLKVFGIAGENGDGGPGDIGIIRRGGGGFRLQGVGRRARSMTSWDLGNGLGEVAKDRP